MHHAAVSSPSYLGTSQRGNHTTWSKKLEHVIFFHILLQYLLIGIFLIIYVYISMSWMRVSVIQLSWNNITIKICWLYFPGDSICKSLWSDYHEFPLIGLLQNRISHYLCCANLAHKTRRFFEKWSQARIVMATKFDPLIQIYKKYGFISNWQIVASLLFKNFCNWFKYATFRHFTVSD